MAAMRAMWLSVVNYYILWLCGLVGLVLLASGFVTGAS